MRGFRLAVLAAALTVMAAFALVAPAGPAWAADPGNGAREAQIRQRIVGLLEQFGGGPGTARYEAIAVTRRGDGFDISISGLVFAAADGVEHALGTVVARLLPVDERYDDITLTLPEMWRYRGHAGRVGEVRLGRQAIAIRWDSRLAASTEFDLELAKIEVALDGVPKAEARIDTLSLRSALKDKGGRWSGPVRFRLGGFMGSDDTTGFRLAEARVSADIDRADLIALYDLARPPNGSAPATSITLGGLDLLLAVKGLEIVEADAGTLSLNEGSYHLAMPGADQPRFDASIDVNQKGLRANGAYELFNLLNFRLSMLIEQVRSAELSRRLLVAGLEPAIVGDEEADAVRAEPGLPDLVEALAAAAAAIRFDGEQSSPRGFASQFDGHFRADAGAANKWVGELSLKMTDPAAGGLPLPDNAESFVDGIRALGEPIDGGTRLLYRFDFNQDGSVDLNGRPMLPPSDRQTP